MNRMRTPTTFSQEGYVDFRGHRVWYGVAGEGEEPDRLPLLVMHGGPALPHDYLEPLTVLTQTGRPVIFYDQLGCGNSDRPSDPSMWNLDLFVEELASVRRALDLNRVHIYGHSYGGALLLQYALTQPEGLASMTLANTFPSARKAIEGIRRLRGGLPPEVRRVFDEHEAAGTTESPAYQAVFREHFLRRNVCKVPLPECVGRSFRRTNMEIYLALHGPSWFELTGEYRGWDVTDRLGEIQAPALITVGRDDQCVPELSETLHRGIKGSELAVFEGSSHLPFIEEPDLHARVVNGFLARVESRELANG